MNEQGPEQEVSRERDHALVPKIWVASLSDYNAGRLVGEWMPADREPGEIHHDIEAILTSSPEPEAEEWAIFDYEGFGPLGLSEYESIERVSEVACGIAKHGEAFAYWAHHLGPERWEELERFEVVYHGQYESVRGFVDEWLEVMGAGAIPRLLPSPLRLYIEIDYTRLEFDLSIMYDIFEGPDGVYVFYSS